MNKKIKTTIVINKNGMGEAPQELRETLIKNYLTLLIDETDLPTYICFYGEGVKLTLNTSHVIDELKKLQELGIKILICKTCLLYFNSIENVAIGDIATMLDIMGAQKNCDKVIVL
jgi:intracellular sulfur oxidation DsrE/DsrF family protein